MQQGIVGIYLEAIFAVSLYAQKRLLYSVAADYYRAMNDVERRLELVPTPEQPPAEPGQLVALVDALSSGTLNDSQRELVHALRSGILALAEQIENESDFAPANVLG